MRVAQISILSGVLLIAIGGGNIRPAIAQNTSAPQTSSKPATTGFALKKPVFGGACANCPWGAMAIVVKKALAPYGWDVQICWDCA